MLEVRCEFTIQRDDCPAVLEYFDFVATFRDHRFHGQHHAGPQFRAGARPPVIRHLRILVHLGAHAVPDQLAHDVDTLTTINDDVTQSRNPLAHRLVPYIFVAPTDRLAIGRLATDVYNRYYAGLHGLRRNRELALLGRFVDAGRDPVRGELLSYLFFAPEFIRPLLDLGRRDAQQWLDRQGAESPWRTEHPWSGGQDRG